MILETIAEKYLWFLVAILAVNLYQRKFTPRSYKKRTATLIIASLAMVWQIFIVIILSRGWPHWFAVPALALTVAIAIPFRNRILLFRATCSRCNAKLPATAIINYDDNLCAKCWADDHPEEQVVEEIIEEEPVPLVTARSVEEIDWDSWEPTETAVLCYLFEGDKVLLIDKKSGFGKGKVSAPGGHVEDYETASEAAIREFKEETLVDIPSVEPKGILEFQFVDGLAMRGYVFFAHSYTGQPTETEEARPFWCPIAELPYDKMWADDRLWLPLALEGRNFTARFIFDGDDMLSHQIIES